MVRSTLLHLLAGSWWPPKGNFRPWKLWKIWFCIGPAGVRIIGKRVHMHHLGLSGTPMGAKALHWKWNLDFFKVSRNPKNINFLKSHFKHQKMNLRRPRRLKIAIFPPQAHKKTHFINNYMVRSTLLHLFSRLMVAPKGETSHPETFGRSDFVTSQRVSEL